MMPKPNLDTKLGDLDQDFIRLVLPKLSLHGWNGCWVYIGTAYSTDGVPIYRTRRKTGIVRRSFRAVVYEMFNEIPEDKVVGMACQRSNCLNPNHMVLINMGRPKDYRA